MSKKAFIIYNALHPKAGGMTRSMLLRANFLVESGYNVSILTTDFNQHHLEAVVELQSLGLLSHQVKVRNFYIDASQFGSILNSLFSFILSKKSIYKGEFKREKIKWGGELVRHYDHFGNEVCFSYKNSKGKEYLRRYLGGNLSSLALFKGRVFTTIEDVQYKWLAKIVTKNSLLFSEQRRFDPMLNALRRKCKSVAVIHMNHFKADGSGKFGLQAAYKKLYARYDKITKVFPTKSHLEDIIHMGYHIGSKSILPNSYLEYTLKDKTVFDRELKVVIVSRLSSEKRINHVIEIIKEAKKLAPNLCCDIYGAGADEGNLKELVKSYNLTDAIIFKGFTKNAIKSYATGSFTLFTSVAEGSMMTISEAMAAGVVAVSYDFKYGPRENIKHGETGFIVENGNIKQAASYLVELMKNDELRKTMSFKSVSVAEKYLKENYERSWGDFFVNLERA